MNKHIKMCSTALVIRKTNIKNTVRYYSLPTRMPVVTKTDNIQCLGYGEAGTLIPYWWERKMLYPLGKQFEHFFKN